MRGNLVLLLFIIGISLIRSIAFAQYCGLGTMQPVKGFAALPGSTVEAKLYFYNLYDTLTTHVLLTLTDAPPGWGVEIEPPARDVIYETPLGSITVLENIDVPLTPKTPNCEGTLAGYELIRDTVTPGACIPAKVVLVRIKVPQNVEIGKTYEIKLTATGRCLSPQVGNVFTSQVREFTFQVKPVLSGEFYEIRREGGFSIWDFIVQNALLFSLLLGVLCAIVIILILRMMGKLVIEIKLK